MSIVVFRLALISLEFDYCSCCNMSITLSSALSFLLLLVHSGTSIVFSNRKDNNLYWFYLDIYHTLA